MGLHEDAVDLLEAGFALAVADGFEQGADAEVADASQKPFGGADDEGERVVGEGVVRKPAAVELVEDEGADVVGCERVNRASPYFLWKLSFALLMGDGRSR